MGVIYTTAEVATSALPMSEAHTKAAQEVLEQVSSIGGAVLTMIHGSVAEGRASIRSDLDVFITYDYPNPEAEPAVVSKIKAALRSTSEAAHVKPEYKIWPANDSYPARQARMKDILFSLHLAASMPNDHWRRGEPDESIIRLAATEYDVPTLVSLMLDYTTHKHSRFVEAPEELDETDTKMMETFQRALEFPVAIARKVKHFKEVAGPDMAAPIDERCLSEPSGFISSKLTDLSKIDNEYSDLLWFLAESDPDPRLTTDYSNWLKDRYPIALKLSLMASSAFEKVVERMATSNPGTVL